MANDKMRKNTVHMGADIKYKLLILFIFLCCIGVISTILLRQKYEIFFSPFQLITHEDVAKNQQGICVAENRKLSEAELVSRAMVGHFEQIANATRPTDAYKAGEPMCSDEESCDVTKSPALTMSERLTQEAPKASFDYDIRFVSNVYVPNAYKNKEFDFSSYLFVPFVVSDYFPKDCCHVISGEAFNQLPEDIRMGLITDEWRKRGWGSYVLSQKSMSWNNWGWHLQNIYIALDTCGNVLIDRDKKNEDIPILTVGEKFHQIDRYKEDDTANLKRTCFPIPSSEIWEATHIKNKQFFKCVQNVQQGN